MKTIWVIDEGSQGHLSQSVGLAEGLAKLTPSQIVIIKGRSKLRGWQRPFVQCIMGKHGRPLTDRLMSWVVDLKFPEQFSKPDLILSSGGKSVFAARTLSKRYQIPYIYIGERKPYPATWFDLIISPVLRESSFNSIDVELIPTAVSPQGIAQHGVADPDVWCMIIGGASRSHQYTDADWISLAESMNTLARSQQIRWLVSTSRRTGSHAEALIRSHIDPQTLIDAIWWGEIPRKELHSFMARSEALFVTQDSITMATEAVSSGKFTVLVSPPITVFRSDSFLPDYFQRLESNRRIIRTSIVGMSQVYRSDFKDLQPFDEPSFDQIAKSTAERIWK